jgi:hypothetical protein
MSAQIVDRTVTGYTLQVIIPYNPSMLDYEETLQQKLNEAGVLATQEGLSQFDTDGPPITLGSLRTTRKGQLPKDYQCPYDVAAVERHASTRDPRAARPTVPSTGTHASSSVPHPSSPRWSRANMPSSVRPASSTTWSSRSRVAGKYCYFPAPSELDVR